MISYIVYIVLLFIAYMVYMSLKNTLLVVVYSMDPSELTESKKFIREQYPDLNISYKVYNNEREFREEYADLLILRKKCMGCKFIPLGNTKYLTENLPLDFFDLTK